MNSLQVLLSEVGMKRGKGTILKMTVALVSVLIINRYLIFILFNRLLT